MWVVMIRYCRETIVLQKLFFILVALSFFYIIYLLLLINSTYLNIMFRVCFAENVHVLYWKQVELQVVQKWFSSPICFYILHCPYVEAACVFVCASARCNISRLSRWVCYYYQRRDYVTTIWPPVYSIGSILYWLLKGKWIFGSGFLSSF